MMEKKIPLLFSDVDYGCEEYGFIPRRKREDVDDEDFRYERHVVGLTRLRVRVIDGYLLLGPRRL